MQRKVFASTEFIDLDRRFCAKHPCSNRTAVIVVSITQHFSHEIIGYGETKPGLSLSVSVSLDHLCLQPPKRRRTRTVFSSSCPQVYLYKYQQLSRSTSITLLKTSRLNSWKKFSTSWLTLNFAKSSHPLILCWLPST